jgi:hypothetical protein
MTTWTSQIPVGGEKKLLLLTQNALPIAAKLLYTKKATTFVNINPYAASLQGDSKNLQKLSQA